MARILRGEIRWADLNPVRGREQAGARPVLVLSHDVFNERSGTIIAVALTSQPQRAGFPLTLELDVRGLPKKSSVKIGQMRTLSVEAHRRQVPFLVSIFGGGLNPANFYSRVSLGLRDGNFLPAVESYRVKAPIGAGRL